MHNQAVALADKDRFVSPSGKRAHPRIRLPITIEAEAGEFETADWSIGGFALRETFPAAQTGATLTVDLRLGSGEAMVRLRHVQVEVLRAPDEGGTAFRFVGLSNGQVRLLERVVADHLNGQLTSFEHLLKSAANAKSPPATGVPAVAQAQPAARERMLRLRAGIMIAVLALAVLLFGALVLRALFTVQARYAMAVAPTQAVLMPVTGSVHFEGLAAERLVPAGDPLFRVASPGERQEMDRLRAARTDHLSRKAILQQQLTEARALNAALSGAQARREAAIGQSISAMDAEIRLRSDSAKRLRDLARQGYVPALQADQEEIALAQAQRARAQLVDEQARLSSDRALYASGLATSTVTSTTTTAGRLQAELAAADAAIAGIDATLAQMSHRQIVSSPCDCEVQALLVSDGGAIAAGAPVLRLKEVHRDLFVRALVAPEEAAQLSIGARAKVRLADGSTYTDGRIRRIDLRNVSEPEATLPLPAQMTYGLATVDVGLPRRLPDDADGWSAEVRFFPSLFRQSH